MSARVEVDRRVGSVVPAPVRGSAAPRIERPATSVRVSGRALVLLLLVLVVLTLAVAPMRAYLGERSQLAELGREADELRASNTALERRIERLNDPAYLERLARECLGMVEPGETAFVMIPQHGRRQLPDC